MNVVIISKEKYEEMVGKLNLLSDRVNEIIGKREKGKLSRWMDNQEVCQQLRISPRTLQTLRDNGTLAYLLRILIWISFLRPIKKKRKNRSS